ncbi:MAG: phenylalanine--tRNA ligase subunit beta [bacterium]
MKLPLSWLKEYVDFELTPKELASLLTFSGTEVEGIKTIGGDFTGLIVGEVLSVERHPNADRLTVCQVNDGTSTLTVVCGAPNVAAGIKVPLATIGTTLPNGLKIKKAKVRGIESFGMLCAADELGLSEDHNGLMILPADVITGTPFSEIVGPPETVLELEVTPNRPDCLSMIGMAREVATLLGKPLKIPAPVMKESGTSVESLASVTIEDAVGCPRYTGRVVQGITIAPSPQWLQSRLSAAGIRPINNVVDITNYVMLESGQPLHAFDYELLEGHKIVVRRARVDEAMSTLDGAARELTSEMLLIADVRRPVAVAGVMGGAGSEIRDVTKTVLLESAYFKPSDVRKTSKKMGLSSESSYRFERGVDVENVEWVSRRAVQLMCELAGGVAAKGVIDVYPTKTAHGQVTLRFARVRDLLGIEITNEKVMSIFTSLGFGIVSNDAVRCVVDVPAFRVDVLQEADLIEEVARINGLDKIPSPSPVAKIVPGVDDKPTRAVLALRENLVGLGLAETMNYSFLSEKLLDLVDYGDAAKRVVLPNPISADHTILRDSFIPQMIETLGKNRARQAREASLFEMGRVFFKDADGKNAESDRICIGLMGPVGRAGILKSQPVKDEEMFQWIKGILESLGRAQHVAAVARGGLCRLDIELKPLSSPCFEEGRAVSVWLAGVNVGVMGLVSERLRNEWRMADPVAVLELEVAPLLKDVLRVPVSHGIGSFPGVDRDVAMVVEDGISHEAILKSIWTAAPPELVDIQLFDVYRGENLGKGRKSLAYSLTYRSMDKTLTDEVANAFHDKVKAALRKDVAADIREG